MNPALRLEIKRLLHIAWPVVLGQLGHITVGLADSLMIGRTGAVPLAASALANSIFIIPLVFVIGLSYGVTPLVANADGQGDRARVGSILSQGIAINLFMSVLLSLLLWQALPLLAHFGQAPEVLQLAGPYLGILTMGMVPLMLFLSLKQFTEGLSDTRPAMVISLLSNLVNVVLNYVLIYGKWGAPELGLMGAGYATLIARSLMALSMWLYMLRSKQYAAFRADLIPRKLIWFRIRRILHIGVPSGLQYIFEVGAFASAAVIIGTLGAVPLAAHQIAISLASVSYMAASGIGAAATVRTGKSKGQSSVQGIRHTAMASVILVVVLMSFAGMVFALGRNWLPTLYNDQAEVIAIASRLLIVAVFFQLSDGLQVVGLSLLRGLEDVRLPTLITFLTYWMLALPFAWLLGIQWEGGVFRIWVVLACALTLAAILLIWRFNTLLKRMAKQSLST